jgi:TorA maturation chaperone TorD
MVGQADIETLLQAVAEDLRLLAALHADELNAEQLEELRQFPFQDYLGLLAGSPATREALQAMDAALAATEAPAPAVTLDTLAADYADIYLTYRYRAAPSESAWVHPERLERQEPMFAVRRWHRRYGVQVPDWRVRPDDHLVNQLLLAGHILECEPPARAMDAAGRFLDNHLLVWAPDFFARVAARCATPFYAALALLSAAYVEEARALLEQLTGEERQVRQPDDTAAASACDGTRYLPGTAPSW